MEVRNFMNDNKNVSFLDLKEKLYKEHNIKINEDIKNNYYMLTSTNKSDYNNIFIRQCTGLILEKDNSRISKKIHINTNDIKKIIYKYSNICINKTPKLINNANLDIIKTNSEDYIIEKEICKNDNNTLNLSFILNV